MQTKQHYVDIFDDRSEEGYTYINPELDRNGWEAYVYGGSYSSFHKGLKEITNEQAVKVGLGMVHSYLPIFRFQKPPKIVLTKSDVSMNFQTNQIKLEIGPFKETRLTRNQQLDVFMGDFFHEVAHFLFTEGDKVLSAMQSGKLKYQLHKELWNIVEDEMIERSLGDHYPGYVRYIGKMKMHTFGTKYLDGKKKWEETVQQWVSNLGVAPQIPRNARLMEVLFNVIRFPGSLAEEDLKEYADFIKQVQRICSRYPTTTQGCIDVALQLYKLIEQEVKNNQQGNQVTQSGSGQGQSSGQQQGQSQSKDSSGQGNQQETGTPSGQLQEQRQEQQGSGESAAETQQEPQQGEGGEQTGDSEQDGKEESDGGNGNAGSDEEQAEGSGQQSKSPAGNSSAVGGSTNDEAGSNGNTTGSGEPKVVEMAATDVLQMLEQFSQNIGEHFPSLDAKTLENNDTVLSVTGTQAEMKQMAEKLRKLWKQVSDEPEEYEQGVDSDVRFYRATRNEWRYKSELAELNGKGKTLRRLLEIEHRDLQYKLKSMKSGRLDTAKLVEAVQGVPTVYEQQLLYRTEKISIGLLLDASGSMDDEYSDDVPEYKIKLARKIGILFDEGLKNSHNVNNYFAYAYSSQLRGGDSTDIYIIKEPGYYHPANFGSIEPRGATHEGAAVWDVAHRMRKYTQDAIVLFVISDGSPCGSRYKSEADARRHCKQAADKAKKMGIIVVHIAVDPDAVNSGDMYEHRFDCTGLDDLPQHLGRIMKEVTRKLIKPRFV